MAELWPQPRIGPQPQALHHGYEKAGVFVDSQPIPWNAEAVVVEAIVRAYQPRRKTDFALRVADSGTSHSPEDFHRDESNDCFRLHFRLPVPARTTSAELYWRDRSLGQLTLPILGRDEFCRKLAVQMPALSMQIGEHTIACQTYVSTQCSGCMATALLSSATSLVPLLDLAPRVEFYSEHGELLREIPIALTRTQLRARQALVTVAPPRPRRRGAWLANWLVADALLASVRINAVSGRQFQQSLRLSGTRFVVQRPDGQVHLTRVLPPMEEVTRVGPCFLVSSREPGMAGLCSLQIRAIVEGAVQSPLLHEQEVLITDGPTPFAPGTLSIDDMEQVAGFELRIKNQLLGFLPLHPAPSAHFSAEGGFTPPPDFAWSPAADDQLQEKLEKLLDEKK
jgi:hypothetical protein